MINFWQKNVTNLNHFLLLCFAFYTFRVSAAYCFQKLRKFSRKFFKSAFFMLSIFSETIIKNVYLRWAQYILLSFGQDRRKDYFSRKKSRIQNSVVMCFYLYPRKPLKFVFRMGAYQIINLS